MTEKEARKREAAAIYRAQIKAEGKQRRKEVARGAAPVVLALPSQQGLPRRKKVREDLKGKVYGQLTVGEYAETVGAVGARKALWWVQCGCGSPAFKLRAEQLTRESGRTHCGCGGRRDRGQMVGVVRGKLTVLGIEHPASEGPEAEPCALKGKEKYRVRWRCGCACGREILLRTNQLREEDGRTCCGCDLKTSNGHPRKIRGVEGAGYLARRAAGEVKDVRRKRAGAGAGAGAGAVDGEWPERQTRGRRMAELATAVRTGKRLVSQEAARPVAGEMDAAGWLKLLVLMREGGARWVDMGMELEEAGRKGVTRERVEAEVKKRAAERE